jgi:hypothetical protein
MPCVLNFILGAIMYSNQVSNQVYNKIPAGDSSDSKYPQTTSLSAGDSSLSGSDLVDDHSRFLQLMIRGGVNVNGAGAEALLAGDSSDSKYPQATSLSHGASSLSGSDLVDEHSSFLKWMIETGVNVNGAGAQAELYHVNVGCKLNAATIAIEV